MQAQLSRPPSELWPSVTRERAVPQDIIAQELLTRLRNLAHRRSSGKRNQDFCPEQRKTKCNMAEEVFSFILDILFIFNFEKTD